MNSAADEPNKVKKAFKISGIATGMRFIIDPNILPTSYQPCCDVFTPQLPSHVPESCHRSLTMATQSVVQSQS